MLTAKEFLEQDEVLKFKRISNEHSQQIEWTRADGESVKVVGKND